VRVYYFCPENGIYQGEDFQDKDQLDTVNGVTAVPPPLYHHGEVPVFDAATQSWSIQKLVGKRLLHRDRS
jgi:hypothetical protein